MTRRIATPRNHEPLKYNRVAVVYQQPPAELRIGDPELSGPKTERSST